MGLAPRTRRLASLATLCVAVAALFWVKLKLVRSMPRTAYAEPAEGLDPDERRGGSPD